MITLLRTSCKEDGQLSLKKLMEFLQKMQYDVRIVEEHMGVKQTDFCCCIVRHSFLLCFGRTGGAEGELPYRAPEPFIVDPFFKAQFDVQHPSVAYSAVMEFVPDVFIGPCSVLEDLIRILCCQMEQSFKKTHAPLPPWRTFKSMLARWTHPLKSYTQDGGCVDVSIAGSV